MFMSTPPKKTVTDCTSTANMVNGTRGRPTHRKNSM